MDSHNSLSDDEFEGQNKISPSLTFEDEILKSSILSRLNTLRKGGHFCDVTLQVGKHNIPSHKAVLASSSVYFHELFCEEENVNIPYINIENVDYESFVTLVDYVYTARLDVPEHAVKNVYKTAKLLKMERAAEACAHFMVDNLSYTNCLGIRNFANSYSDKWLTDKTDDYIRNNIDNALRNSEVLKIPHLQIKIIGVTDLEETNEQRLSSLVVNFFKLLSEKDEDFSLDEAMENARVLYLGPGNHLVDCMDIKDETINQNDIITDYKKKNKHTQMKLQKKEQGSLMTNGTGEKMKSHENPASLVEEEWLVIAIKSIGDTRCTCIAVLGDQLVTLTIKCYPQEPVIPRSGSPIANGSSPSPISSLGSPGLPSGEKPQSLEPLTPMSCPRCGLGTAVLDNKLVAIGGYDRGECLNTVELYDLETNKWSTMPPMLTPRGRFDVSQIHGKLYACGGSNGSQELKSAECYDPELGKWVALPDMSTTRTSAGVGVLDNKLYIVGGWNGCSGLKSCEVFDPETNKWSPIASLHSGRSQSAVCAFQGKLLSVGGCDAWNCSNTVEVYDPVTDKWSLLCPMATSRRGAGVVVYDDKLYVIGGSDGQHALTSVEIYNPDTGSWSTGPNLNTPRANVAVALVQDWIIAVGGFSGKTFLDSIEYLSNDHEWSSFLRKSKSPNGGCSLNGNGLFEHSGDIEEEDPLAGM